MKGQYFSFDAIIASVIFVLALVALLSYWHSVRSFLEYQNDPMSKEVIRVSNLLFVPGTPSSDCNTMTAFGLAISYDDRRVNSSTISCMSMTKDEGWLMNSLRTPYNVSIKVMDISGARDTVFIGGQVPPAGGPNAPANVVKIRRLSSVVDADGSTYLAAFDMSLYK
jgi:hypothetical protein